MCCLLKHIVEGVPRAVNEFEPLLVGYTVEVRV